jgi:hypothetical protein
VLLGEEELPELLRVKLPKEIGGNESGYLQAASSFRQASTE